MVAKEDDAAAAASSQDALPLPTQKMISSKLKSPTPGTLRDRSATPVRGRSSTPFSAYITRRSGTPSVVRSITPFLRREEKEKTPFELGYDLKTQMTCNKAVIDKALIMDITESEDCQKPVRYITSDLSVLDRAAVMDVSNVEVIYVVEEYEDGEEAPPPVVEEVEEDSKAKKKEKSRDRRKSKLSRLSSEVEESSLASVAEVEDVAVPFEDAQHELEDSFEIEETHEPAKKGKKKHTKKKRDRSSSPKLKLKLEMGAGSKANKKMFDSKPAAKPPPKKSKLALEMEAKMKAAAKAAQEEADRIRKAKEERERREAELRAQREEEERLAAEAEAAALAEAEAEEYEEGEWNEEWGEEYGEGEAGDEELIEEVPEEEPERRGSDSSDDFVRPDPDDELRWKRIAENEGEQFMQDMRNYCIERKTEKERDTDWKKRREQARFPRFMCFLTDRTAQAGQNVRLNCAVDGPELSIKWFKDGKQLERDNYHRIVNNNNILSMEIIGATSMDNGEYKCVVSNMNDTISSSCNITVYERFKDQPKPPSFRLIREYYHMRTEELTIECHINGVPRPRISWWREVFEVTPSYKYAIVEEAHGVCKLIIYKPTARDSGTYTCKAVNTSGAAETSHVVEIARNPHYHVPGIFHARDRIQQDKEHSAKKVIEEALQSKAESDKRRAEVDEIKHSHYRESAEPMTPMKQKLQFTTHLRDRVALEGSTVKFFCTVLGPNPSFRWMKDDNYLSYSENIKPSSEEGKAVLELMKVNRDSTGIYKCIARNPHSEIDTSCLFKVFSAQTDGDEQEPIFTLPLRDTYHSTQNDLILDTKVRGNPRPTITWLKSDMAVVLNHRVVQIEHADGLCELIINKPTARDAGQYTCVAQNHLGTQKVNHLVVPDSFQESRRSSVLSSVSGFDSSAAERARKEASDRLSKLKKKRDEDSDDEPAPERRTRLPDPTPRQQLWFIVDLSNRYVEDGSRVKMQAVIGGPNPSIRWQKNGEWVNYTSKIRNLNRESLAVIEFLEAHPEDSGTYTIVVQNDTCKITTSAQLVVYQSKVNIDAAPVFVKPIKDNYRLHNNELILETSVRGHPTPEIRWFHEYLELNNDSKYQIIQLQDGTCQLFIYKPNKWDSGKFYAKAENRAGKAELCHEVTFSGMQSHIDENIRGVFHADKSKMRPKPGDKNALLFSDSESEVEKEESSEYDSDTEPEEGADQVDENELRFISEIKNRVVVEGSDVKLSCFVKATEETQVYWYKDDEAIHESANKVPQYNEGLCWLDITSATEEDSGEYKCWAYDDNSEALTVCTLEVQANPGTGDVAPSFTRNIEQNLERKKMTLKVVVEGMPTPLVVWLKDGVALESSARYEFTESDDGTCELALKNPVPEDSGVYTCQAQNREGQAEVVHEVTIKPRKKRPPPEEVKGPTEEEIQEQLRLEAEEVERQRKLAEEAMKEKTPNLRREVPAPPDLRKNVYFRNYLTNRTVKEGSDVKWMVTIDGPEPYARWYHEDEPLSSTSKCKMACSSGIAWLNLVKVTEEDAGKYTLRAKGPENEIVCSCTLFVYSPDKEDKTAPIFVVPIKDNYSLHENELVLDCRVRGKPRPQIQWMKGTDYLQNSPKYRQVDQPDGYSKLVINNPTENDAGLYTCIASNDAAKNKITHLVDFSGRERFTLEKTHGFFHRDINKPHFLAQLGNQTVSPGGTIAISAEFMATDAPIDVHWYRDRQLLNGRPNVKTFMDKGVYTMAIMNATPEDEGTYTCRASTQYGHSESHANVDVAINAPTEERPPLFLSRPDTEMKIAFRDPFSLSFRVSGEPKPKLTFMKGTRDITKSDRVTKEVSDDYTRFTVQRSQISDCGTYFVVARNAYGTDRIFVSVTVKPRARSETPSAPRWGQPLETFADTSYFRDPPGPISTEPLVVDSGPTHISLSWGKPVSNNSAPVIAYRIDAWMKGHEGGAIWKELGLSPINSFDAFNLKSNCEYHFRVTPKNRYGWGPSVQTSSPLQVGGAECLPEFVQILPGQLKALLDSELMLECTVRGAPRPQVSWYKDGIHLTNISERLKIKQMGSTCTLIISKVNEMDTGRYTCEATNAKGRVSTFARIQVVADSRVYAADTKLKEIIHNQENSRSGDTLPIFTMRLRDRRVQMTYPVRLTCQVIGYPMPEVSWFKDGDPIESGRRCMISEDGQFRTLELNKTTLDDGGIYTCTARNELGSVSCHCTLVVDKGIRAYITPDFYMPLDPLYIFEEGNQIRLSAKVEAYPSVGVSWFRNGVRLRPSRRILASLDHNGFVELTIAEAKKLDAGIYTCVASNAVGRVESICRVTIEDVDEPSNKQLSVPIIRTTDDMPYSKEPLFVVKPRSSEAYEGDTVIIFCEVVGDPKPDVIWLRDFLKPEYYKDAQHFRRIGEGPEYRLEIPSAKFDFTGTYSIIASNCHGEAKAVISLQIFAKDIFSKVSMEKGSIRQGNVETLPRFVRHLRDLRCCDGDAITLECHVEAVPEPIIIWEKDGHVLHSGDEFIMSYDGIKATLSIPRVYPEDEGEYTCIAKNSVGRNLSSACIIVDLPEENENMLSRLLSRPIGLLSASSTPYSTPRSTPNRGFSPLHMSYRCSSIDFDGSRSRRAVSSAKHTAVIAPKFLAIPHNRVVEEGDSVRFQCAITGNPTPWSTWDKEGVIVMPTTRISIKEVNDLRFLEIEEVNFEDAGLYRITLENDYGRIEATARLDVIISSRYSKSPSARRVRASSSKRNAYLHRRIMGYSTAIGGRMALAASGCRGNSVPSCQLHDSNEQCIANHCEISRNKDQSEELLQIVRHLPKTIETIEQETVDLQFRLKCSEPYTCVWKRNGKVIDESEDFSYIDHGNGEISLRIYDTFDLDSGLYSCEIQTDSGLSCCTSSHLIVRNSGDDIELKDQNDLRILKSPLPVIATNNDDEVAFCARVYPLDASVSWIVCGHEITEDFATTCTLESSLIDGERKLRIRNLKDFGQLIFDDKNSSGGYSGEVQLIVSHPGKHAHSLRAYTSMVVWPQCATNDAVADDENQLELNVNKPQEQAQEQPHLGKCAPVILESPNQCTTAFIGDNVSLTVAYRAEPDPEIRWLKACRPIVENGNKTITRSGNRSTLLISDITADDSGKYTVEVMNELGMDSAVASVSVEGPPDPPSGKPSISQGPDRIAIAWCGPPYDGGCIINGFIIEMMEIVDGTSENDDNVTWREIAKVVDSLAYTVKNLNPKSSYRFRVRAENVHGRSAPSSSSDQVQIGADLVQEESQNDFQSSIVVRSGGDFKSRFTVIEELGKGRFGVVYKVEENEPPHQILAAKIIKCIKASDRQKVQEEISIMKSLEHPKLLQLAASFESPREIVMVMEFITGGELFERVVADDFTLTERDCTLFLRQICEGVAYMHKQSVVHLDLKPENIMCHTRTSHQIKIIDFGLAQRLRGDSPVRVLFGTPEFIPPEIINYEPIGFQSDMWSIGVICYVLLSGLSPFMGDTDVETFANITRADFDFDDDAFDCVSQEAKDFISHLLVHRKEERWTAERCLASMWLTEASDEQLSNTRICTDKLKKFIIRRKWQKTGNAIRALGRMATLSASRRNSATNSVQNSPRPSLSGVSLLTPNTALQMSSLNEEDDDFSEHASSALQPKRVHHHQRTLRMRDKSQCTERSDSGYSECSNCSGTLPLCHCQQSEKDIENIAKVTGSSNEMSFSIVVPHEVLKSKLEKIACVNDTTTNIPNKTLDEKLKDLNLNIDNETKDTIINHGTIEENNYNFENPLPMDMDAEQEHLPLNIVQAKDPIMHSDFTNTIKMRKKSLEKSVTRENFKSHQTKMFFQSSGKVSRLRGKFDKNVSTKAAASYAKLTNLVGSQTLNCVPAKLTAGNNKIARSNVAANRAVPTTTRLSGRVQEASDRLAKHHTVSSAVRCSKQQTLSSKCNDLTHLTSALTSSKKVVNNHQK